MKFFLAAIFIVLLAQQSYAIESGTLSTGPILSDVEKIESLEKTVSEIKKVVLIQQTQIKILVKKIKILKKDVEVISQRR